MSLFPDDRTCDRPRCRKHNEPLVQGTCFACVNEGRSMRAPREAPPEGSVVVELTEEQHARCLAIGKEKDEQSIRRGMRRRYGQTAEQSPLDHIQGALGEGALAVHVGDWDNWQENANNRGWTRPDVADFYEVRSCARGRNLTTHPAGEEKFPESPFVLAWVDPADREVILVGWLWWKDTMRLGIHRKDWRHPAYLTSYKLLNPMETLPEVPARLGGARGSGSPGPDAHHPPKG